ncbi:hypothetical protein [Chitinophaga sp. MM2321]|uniref:hypothetical protein n=1 Tax=Chitinophaga sp. MM2321 TaxID=3137178 RepID=UPI0032D57EDF
MYHSNLALNLDLSKKYIEAIAEYELSLQKEAFNVNLSINLAFLHWVSAAEFPWADAYKIPNEIRLKGIDRCGEILADAKLKFPECAELYFWERYFWHRITFDPFTEEDTLNILSAHTCCEEIPYFFLYLFDEMKYEKERNSVLKKCLELPTAKNLYIIAIIEDRPPL